MEANYPEIPSVVQTNFLTPRDYERAEEAAHAARQAVMNTPRDYESENAYEQAEEAAAAAHDAVLKTAARAAVESAVEEEMYAAMEGVPPRQSYRGESKKRRKKSERSSRRRRDDGNDSLFNENGKPGPFLTCVALICANAWLASLVASALLPHLFQGWRANEVDYWYPLRMCPRSPAPTYEQYDSTMAFPPENQCKARVGATCEGNGQVCRLMNCTNNEAAIASQGGCHQCCGGTRISEAPCMLPFDFTRSGRTTSRPDWHTLARGSASRDGRAPTAGARRRDVALDSPEYCTGARRVSTIEQAASHRHQL